jgi:hypothetical protein
VEHSGRQQNAQRVVYLVKLFSKVQDYIINKKLLNIVCAKGPDFGHDVYGFLVQDGDKI